MKVSKVLAKVVLQNAEGKILLLRRSETDDRRPNQWDFPGGNTEEGEDFSTAAARETLEEAGIEIEASAIHLAYATAEITDWGSVCWLIFIGKTDKTEVILSDEHREATWVTLDDAIEKITYDRQNKALRHIKEGQLLD